MIVYYVHHHGSGHATRAAAITARCGTPVVGTGSRAAPDGWPGEWVQLPPDTGGATEDVTAGGTLHWAPRRHPGLRERMATVSSLLGSPSVRLLAADVSVEVTLLARLHGVPVVVLAQPGERRDRPHRAAYDAADALLAPWPSRPVRPGWPAHWLRRTVHLGGLSRYDGRSAVDPPGTRRVLVLSGSGGSDVDPERVRAAAASTPDWTWRVAGRDPAPTTAANLTAVGWSADVWTELARADVVVGHAGQNVVAEIAAARRAAVILPQQRPHGEQEETGRVLERAGLATVLGRWPVPADWPAVLDGALARGGAGWRRWSDGRAAERAAAVLDRLAA